MWYTPKTGFKGEITQTNKQTQNKQNQIAILHLAICAIRACVLPLATAGRKSTTKPPPLLSIYKAQAEAPLISSSQIVSGWSHWTISAAGLTGDDEGQWQFALMTWRDETHISAQEYDRIGRV